MTLIPTRSLVSAPVVAFNVITLEHAEAIVDGAQRACRPVILQISENAVRFHGRLGPLAAAVRAIAEEAAVSCSLHLDHVASMDLLELAPQHGFSSVMFDASELPYAENVARTAYAAGFAHAHGLWIESELGRIGGKDGSPPLSAHAKGARTDPAEAARYISSTGVDGLAVAVGSSHAMPDRDATLDHALIAELHKAIGVPLVLHGSSGVPDDEIRRAVAMGITKINVGTALNVAFTSGVRVALRADPSLVDPRAYMRPARDAMSSTVAHFLTLMHCDDAAESGPGRA
jgi:fructose-bisphosphate aldolase class II